MTAADSILAIQDLLGIPEKDQAPKVGPLTRSRLESLAQCQPGDRWPMTVVTDPVVAVAPIAERNISAKGIALVKEFEGCQLQAYLDEAGVWTIGMGHTGLTHKDGTVYKGRTITMAEAERLFDYDMNQFEHRVTALVKMPLTQDQFDALVSFDFNTGGLTLTGGKPSTLLRALNQPVPDLDIVHAQFMVWNKVNGRVLDGLTRRRMSERNLFEGKDPYIVSLDEFRAWKAKSK